MRTFIAFFALACGIAVGILALATPPKDASGRPLCVMPTAFPPSWWGKCK